jgi:hypothetical protein
VHSFTERQLLERRVPVLYRRTYEITSPPDGSYNCAAWAAEDDSQWWEPTPNPVGGWFWPAGVPRVKTIDAYVEAFESIGYEVCDDDSLEEGYQKVVLYGSRGFFLHAARQLPDGRWASKLGMCQDIEHPTADTLEGGDYGNILVRLRRRRERADVTPPADTPTL